MRFLTAIILLVILTACNHNTPTNSTTYWTKPDQTPAEFASDKYQCLQSAITLTQRNIPAISTDSYGNMGDFIQMTNQNNLFSACMESKGYILKSENQVSTEDSRHISYCIGVEKKRLELQKEAMQYSIAHNYGTNTIQFEQLELDKMQKQLTSDRNRLFSYLGTNQLEDSLKQQEKAGYNDQANVSKTDLGRCISTCDTKDMNQYLSCGQNCRSIYKNDIIDRIESCPIPNPLE